MAITIQLTEVPANENVANRIFTLSNKGGSFGTAFDCDIQLPDRSGQVAAKHGCFIANKDKMMVQASSGLSIAIQGMPLASGKSAVLEDGSIISVGEYILLVSIVASINEDDEEEADISHGSNEFQAYFTGSSLDKDDFEDNISMKDDEEVMIKGQTMTQDKAPHFASSGVFSDDPFEDDPFQEEEISLNLDTEDSVETYEESENIETFVAEDDDGESDVILMKKSLVQKVDSEKSSQNDDRNNQQISQLVNLLESQIASNNEQQSKILQVIDKTLTTFMNEFSPEHLEDVFDDFGTPFFVQKEKQYWRSFRKSFNRRLDKGEYHRLFKALLIENMQGTSANSKTNDKADND